jgi:hypothetical protein
MLSSASNVSFSVLVSISFTNSCHNVVLFLTWKQPNSGYVMLDLGSLHHTRMSVVCSFHHEVLSYHHSSPDLLISFTYNTSTALTLKLSPLEYNWEIQKTKTLKWRCGERSKTWRTKGSIKRNVYINTSNQTFKWNVLHLEAGFTMVHLFQFCCEVFIFYTRFSHDPKSMKCFLSTASLACSNSWQRVVIHTSLSTYDTSCMVHVNTPANVSFQTCSMSMWVWYINMLSAAVQANKQWQISNNKIC